MSLRMEFVERAEKGEKIAGLCREFGISRTTGHKWVQRFKKGGYEGLEEESRQPKTTPLATAEELVTAVLEARLKHSKWGAHKLQVVLSPEAWGGDPKRAHHRSNSAPRGARSGATCSASAERRRACTPGGRAAMQ